MIWSASIAIAAVGLLGLTAVETFAGVSHCTHTNPALALCPATGVCNITAKKVINDHADINCSGRDIVVKAGVVVEGGTFKLRAHNITVNGGYTIEAEESPSARVGFELILTGTLDVMGRLLARNMGKGSYIIARATSATSDIRVRTGLGVDVSGSATSADGGDLLLDAGRDIAIESKLDANGKTGGTAANSNRGGTITLRSQRHITVAHELTALGRWWGGGDIALAAAQNVVVTSAGKLSPYGASETGDGGTVEIWGGTSVQLSGEVNAAGGVGSGGGEGQGGSVTIVGGCGGVTMNDVIVITGGEGGGGELEVSARGNVTANGLVDARGIKLDGSGGTISMTSDALVTVANTAALQGGGDQGGSAGALGVGGSIDLEGCRVHVAGITGGSGATMNAQGNYGGKIDLRSRTTTLLPFQSNDYGVRVSEAAVVNAVGATSTQNGSISIAVAQARSGWCSTIPSKACTLDVPDCTVGWQGGQCREANPDLDGRRTQFAPQSVSIVTWSTPPSCGVCP